MAKHIRWTQQEAERVVTAAVHSINTQPKLGKCTALANAQVLLLPADRQKTKQAIQSMLNQDVGFRAMLTAALSQPAKIAGAHSWVFPATSISTPVSKSIIKPKADDMALPSSINLAAHKLRIDELVEQITAQFRISLRQSLEATMHAELKYLADQIKPAVAAAVLS